MVVVFLPPLLYGESIFANFNDLRANLRALTLSTVGLVLVTMCAVAWGRAHGNSGFGLCTRVRPRGKRLADRPARGGDHHAAPGQQHRGRGPFNDATALVAYQPPGRSSMDSVTLNRTGWLFEGGI